MKNYINITAVLALTAVIFFNLSCKENERDFDQEMAELENFILEQEIKGLDVDTAQTGIFYILRSEGEGPTVQQGDTCFIEYQCYSLSNKLIESSLDIYPPNGIWKFIFPPHDIITGLTAGINLMNSKCEMDIIIPSNLAYGKEGTANIPPYTTLIYVTKMEDIGVKND
jgi:FKBP-type peptidyl-prolyl cis-trans isomerase FkpA